MLPLPPVAFAGRLPSFTVTLRLFDPCSSFKVTSLPGFFVFEMLSPLVEMSGYILLPTLWLLGLLSPSVAGTFFIMAIMYTVLVSALAVLLEDIAFRRYPSVRDLGRHKAAPAARPRSAGD